MELGNRFKNVSTGEIFTVEEINEKFGQIIIAGEDGKTKAYSASTLKDKRRFVPVDDDSDASDNLSSPEPVNLTQAEEQYVEKDIEVLTKTGKIKKVKASATGVGFDIKDFVVGAAQELGAEVCESNGRFISFKVNNKMFAAIFSYSKKSLTLGVRGKAIEGKTNPDSVANHMMDARFKFDSSSDSNKDLIVNILTSAYEYQSNLKK